MRPTTSDPRSRGPEGGRPGPLNRAARRPGAAGALLAVLAFGLFGVCGGCAAGPNKADPWEKTNRFVYNLNDGIDRVAMKPAADAYTAAVPKPVRTALGNGFDNLVYFNVVLNDFLQGKWDQGLGDAGRMAANSTVGIGGLLDVASGWGLPAHQNDFGVTLGKWGVGPGPYLVLPLFGPSTLRDSTGLLVEYAAEPLTYLDLPAAVTYPLAATDLIDARSRADTLFRFRNQTALDPYVFTRDAYLQYRASRIREGKPAATAPADQSLYDTDPDPSPATAPATGVPATTAPTTQPQSAPPGSR